MDELQKLAKLADEFVNAARHENRGIGSASGSAAHNTDVARKQLHAAFLSAPTKVLTEFAIRAAAHKVEHPNG